MFTSGVNKKEKNDKKIVRSRRALDKFSKVQDPWLFMEQIWGIYEDCLTSFPSGKLKVSVTFQLELHNM